MNSLPDYVSFQLKLQPQVLYADTIAKAQELHLICSRSGSTHPLNTVRSEEKSHLDQMEQLLQQITEQLAAITSRVTTPQPVRRCCFNYSQPSHLARNCRSRGSVECYRCEARGHLAKNCWNRGNGQGVPQYPEQRASPATCECSHAHISTLTRTTSTEWHTHMVNLVIRCCLTRGHHILSSFEILCS